MHIDRNFIPSKEVDTLISNNWWYNKVCEFCKIGILTEFPCSKTYKKGNDLNSKDIKNLYNKYHAAFYRFN